MNVRMWEHEATQENITVIKARGITVIGPEEGNMACGEYGVGRMAEPAEIATAIKTLIQQTPQIRNKSKNISKYYDLGFLEARKNYSNIEN